MVIRCTLLSPPPPMPFARWACAALTSVLILSACASEPDAEPATETLTDPDEVVETTAPPTDAPSAKLNLNTTPTETFETLPDVGDRMAHEFDEYRPYVSIQQFRREMAKYVDADAIAGYEQYVFVPINRNESDAETLAQLPGVDLDEATLLMEARPFDSDEAFLAALEPHVTPEEQAMAADYLVTE